MPSNTLKWSITKLLYLVPIVDVLVGIAALYLGLYSGNEQSEKMVTLIPGILIRGLLLVFILYFLLKENLRVFLIGISFAIFLLISEVVSYIFYSHSISFLILGTIYVYKIIFIFFFYLAFCICDIEFGKDLALKILPFTVLIYAFAIVIGTWSGTNYHTYGGLGSSGWLIKGSANSVSMAFTAGIPLLLWKFNRYKARFLLSIAISAFMLYAAFLLMTKAAIISTFVTSLLFFVFRFRSFFHRLLFFLIFLSVLIVFYLMMDSLSIVGRIKDVYEMRDNSILAIIFSGRDIHIQHASEIYSSFDFIKLVFGLGYMEFRTALGVYMGQPIGVEIDLFDLVVMNGAVGSLFYLFIPIIITLVSVKRLLFSRSNLNKLASVSFLLLISLSMIAGHVLMSGLNGHLLPLLASIVLMRRFNNENPNDFQHVSIKK